MRGRGIEVMPGEIPIDEKMTGALKDTFLSP